MKVKVGQKSPSFNLPDQDGAMHKLSDYLGQWILVYFYPRDATPGCTKEACMIRDNYEGFKNLKVKVFGISADSIGSHKKFTEKHKLPFTLLSDENKETLKAYGAWRKKKLIGREYYGIARTSFLIDPEGKIAKIYESVKPPLHAKEVLNDLKSFR